MRGKWIVRLTVITLLAGLAVRVPPGSPGVESTLTPMANSPQTTPPAIEKPSFDPATVVQRARATVRDEGGVLTAWAGDSRVFWTAQGLRFETGDAPTWSFHLTGIRQGAIAYDVPPAQPTAQSTAVAYARPGGVTERYLVLDRGVEQLFELAAPLGSGDLVLTGHVETTMAGAPEPAGGLVFSHDGRQTMSYGTATAFDAAGRSTPVAVAYAGGKLSLTVPGPWLAGAAYPVTVDPYLSGDILISRGDEQQWYPAIAYNYSALFPEWLVVWEDWRNGDWDIYAQRVDADGMIKGEVICVADSANDLRRPAVAFDTTQNRYLVAWQDEGTTKAIGARVLNLNGTPFAASFDLTIGTIARTRPDVAYNSVANQFLVVWEYETAADDHNVWGRKVNPDSTVDGGTFQVITHPDDDLEPALVAYPTGQYLLVWTSDRSGTYNVVGKQLPSNGDPTGQSTFQISAGSDDERNPDLALNISNGRALVVWEDSRDDPGNDTNWDVYGRQVYSDGSTPDSGFAICDSTHNQREPAVAYNWATGYQDYLVVWDSGYTIQSARVSGDASMMSAFTTVLDIANGDQHVAVAFGSNRYLVAWTDFRSGFADIMGQRLTSTGALLGYETGLSTGYLSQQQPAIAYSTQQQRWLVVWEDDRAGARRINGQLVTRDGWILGQLIHIGTQGMGQYSPAVAYNSTNDEFMVVWADWRAGNYDVWAQRVDADDGSLHPEFQINTDPEWQWYPAIAYSPDAGQYLVTWSDRRDDPGDSSNYNVYGRRLYANGSPVDANDFVICARAYNQENVTLAYNPVQHQYLVVWEDESMADTGIAGQRVRDSKPGNLEGPNFDICTATGDQMKPSVACNTATGEYLVAWQDRRSVSTYDIYGRRVSGTGTLLGDGDIAISTASQGQEDPHASYDPSRNRYFVCWGDSRNAATAPDIYGQALSASGNLLFTEATENAPVWVYPRAQEYPVASGDPDDGRALAVWQDERNGVSNNIYGRLGSPQDYTVHLPLVLQGD
jgi:hypothetical protein